MVIYLGNAVFVVGTGTDIGKTYVSALLTKKIVEMGKSVGYYKAALSGNDRDDEGNLIPGDAVFVRNFSGISTNLKDMCSYVYEKSVSPHLASRIEGNPMEIDFVKGAFERIKGQYEYVIVEGSGGIMCPLRYDEKKIFLEDLIKLFEIPTVVVADAGLGTINNVVLTCYYMNSKNIPVNGIIFNHYHSGNVMEEDNVYMCEKMTGVPVVGFVGDDSRNIILSEKCNDVFSLFD